MIQKIFVSRAFCGICIILILANLSGCYSNFPIEFSKIDDHKELSKIKLKNKTEYYFADGENQLLSISGDKLTLIDKNGIQKTINFTDIEEFYTYRVDGTKVVFSVFWIAIVTIALLIKILGISFSPGG